MALEDILNELKGESKKSDVAVVAEVLPAVKSNAVKPTTKDEQPTDISRAEELQRHSDMCDTLIANYHADRKEAQSVIDRYLNDAIAPAAAEFPRAAVDVVTRLMEVKSRSGDIVVRALDSRSKLISALKSPSQNNTQNNSFSTDSNVIKSLLAQPMRDDETV